jgi:hypothetical protein
VVKAQCARRIEGAITCNEGVLRLNELEQRKGGAYEHQPAHSFTDGVIAIIITIMVLRRSQGAD